jgi:RNA-directed DNA polymerase
LGIPAVRDRVVQQAVFGVLEPIFEAAFSPHSHGFRPGRSCFSALRELYGQIRAGHLYIVDVDIEKFFDTLAHEPLIDAVAEKVADGSVLRLIRLFLEALIQEGYRLVRPKVGTPQGGVISPLLANIYLAKLDRVLEAEGGGLCEVCRRCAAGESHTDGGAKGSGAHRRGSLGAWAAG